MESKIIFIFVGVLVIVAALPVDDIISSCNGVDAAVQCQLGCLMYPTYTGGECDSKRRCVCVRRPTLSPSKDAEPNGSCPRVNSDTNCSLRCLFFRRYNGGYCQGHICMCMRK